MSGRVARVCVREEATLNPPLVSLQHPRTARRHRSRHATEDEEALPDSLRQLLRHTTHISPRAGALLPLVHICTSQRRPSLQQSNASSPVIDIFQRHLLPSAFSRQSLLRTNELLRSTPSAHDGLARSLASPHPPLAHPRSVPPQRSHPWLPSSNELSPAFLRPPNRTRRKVQHATHVRLAMDSCAHASLRTTRASFAIPRAASPSPTSTSPQTTTPFPCRHANKTIPCIRSAVCVSRAR